MFVGEKTLKKSNVGLFAGFVKCIVQSYISICNVVMKVCGDPTKGVGKTEFILGSTLQPMYFL